MNTLSDDDLRKATIFDLTDDKKLIREALGFVPENRQEFINSCTETGRIISLATLAECSGDKNLISQVSRVFENELALIFNE